MAISTGFRNYIMWVVPKKPLEYTHPYPPALVTEMILMTFILINHLAHVCGELLMQLKFQSNSTSVYERSQ